MAKRASELKVEDKPEDAVDKTCVISRRERRRAETRDRLFEAALRLLSEYDFDSVTVEMITEAADVGKGTFFNYFSNKEAVVSYYYEVQLRLLTDRLQESAGEEGAEPVHEAHSHGGSEGGPFWRKIIGLVHEGAERRHKQKHFTRTLLSLALTNSQVRSANHEFRLRIVDTIRGLIEEAQLHGEIRADATADSLALFMFSAYLGVLYMWSQSDTDESLHKAIDIAYSRVWSGIRRSESADPTTSKKAQDAA